jgi:hypothetical protein
MSVVDYPKTMSSKYDVEQLKTEINNDVEINPSCVAIVNPSKTVCVFQFTANLSNDEVDRLDYIISNHIPQERVIDLYQLPLSKIDSKKLAVHSSTKPEVENITYAMWTGSGDDRNTPSGIGDGDLLQFVMTQGTPMVSKDLWFNPSHGRVWIHEAYLKFEDAGEGDYIEATVVYEGTPVTSDPGGEYNLVLDGKWIKPSENGTHRFSDPSKIVLIPRTYSKDGDWDWDAVNGLRPSIPGQGFFKISEIDIDVHKYYNKIPCNGTTSYFSMTSDETAWLMPGTYIKITAYNNSNTNWTAEVIVEIFRERTFNP